MKNFKGILALTVLFAIGGIVQASGNTQPVGTSNSSDDEKASKQVIRKTPKPGIGKIKRVVPKPGRVNARSISKRPTARTENSHTEHKTTFKLNDNYSGQWPVDVSKESISRFYEEHRDTLFTVRPKTWVKTLVTPDKETALKACKRARAGEDFDELIAEYFVPYFANKPQGKYVEKRAENTMDRPERFFHVEGKKSVLEGMKPGNISDPVLRFGKGPEWAVVKVVSITEGYVEKLDDVRDSIYQMLWYKAADGNMLKEVKTGKNTWCGTCRAGYNINGQLWRLAQQYDKAGNVKKAVSACLKALNESRGRSGNEVNKNGQYPEEQYLADHGLDIVRYYAGSFRYYPRFRPPVKGWDWRLSKIKDDRGIELLLKLAGNLGQEGSHAGYVLASRKERRVIPLLREMLKDKHIHIQEHHRGGVVSYYAHYYVRDRACDALKLLGEDISDVKVVIGEKVIHGK
jgi:hypothetical protein